MQVVPSVNQILLAFDLPTVGDYLAYITLAVLASYVIVDKVVERFRRRGFDPSKTARRLEQIETHIAELNKTVEKLDKLTNELHEAHLGDKATDRDGRPKWWNKDAVEDAVLKVDKVLEIMVPWLKEQRRQLVRQGQLLTNYHNTLMNVLINNGIVKQDSGGSGAGPAVQSQEDNDLPPLDDGPDL